MKRWKLRILIIAALLGALTAGAVLTYVLTRPASSLPPEVRSKLNFSPLVVASGSEGLRVTNFRTASTEEKTQTLTYTLSLADKTIVVNQYVQPSQFTDIPEYKEKFLSNIVNQTSTVQSAGGVIYLGRTSPDNKQIGVMLERGLLVFLNPSSELSDDLWRQVGDSLQVERINR